MKKLKMIILLFLVLLSLQLKALDTAFALQNNASFLVNGSTGNMTLMINSSVNNSGNVTGGFMGYITPNMSIQTPYQEFVNERVLLFIEKLREIAPGQAQNLTNRIFATEKQSLLDELASLNNQFYEASIQCGLVEYPFNQTIEEINNFTIQNQNFSQTIQTIVEFNLYISNIQNQLQQETSNYLGAVLTSGKNQTLCIQSLLSVQQAIPTAENNLKQTIATEKNETWGEISQIMTAVIEKEWSAMQNPFLDSRKTLVERQLQLVISNQDPLEAVNFLIRLENIILASQNEKGVALRVNENSTFYQNGNETFNYSYGEKRFKIRGFVERMSNSTGTGYVDLDVNFIQAPSNFTLNLTRGNQSDAENAFGKQNGTMLLMISVDKDFNDSNIGNATFSFNLSKESLDGAVENYSNIVLFTNHKGVVSRLNFTAVDMGGYYEITFTTSRLSDFAAYMIQTINPGSPLQAAPASGGSATTSVTASGASFWMIATFIAVAAIGAAYFITSKKTKKMR
jgi:hypothetical protein